MVGVGRDIAVGADGALFSFLACSKHSVVADPTTRTTELRATRCWPGRRGGVVAGVSRRGAPALAPDAIRRAIRT